MSHGFHFGSSCKTFPDNNTPAVFGVLDKNKVPQSQSMSSPVIVHRQQKIFDRLTRRVILVSSKLLPPLELSSSPSPTFLSHPQPPLSSLNSNSQSHIHCQSKSQSQPQHQSQPPHQSKPLLPQSSLARRLTIKTTNTSKQTIMNKNTNRQKHQHLQKKQQLQPSQQRSPSPHETMLQQHDIKRQQQTDSMIKRRVPTPIRRNYHNDKSINNNATDTNNTDNTNNDGGDQDRKGKFFPSTTPKDQLSSSSSSSIKPLTTTSTVMLKPNLTRSLNAITVSSKTLRHANNKRSISLSKIHEHKTTQQDSHDDNDNQIRLKKLRRMRLLRERQMMAMMEKETVDVHIEKDERKEKLDGEEEIEDRRKQRINNDKLKKELAGNYITTTKFVKKKEMVEMKDIKKQQQTDSILPKLKHEETIEETAETSVISTSITTKYFSNPNLIPPPSITAATIATIDNAPYNNKHDIIRKDNNSINDININSPRSLYDNSSNYGFKTNILDIANENENLKSSPLRTSSNDQRKVKGDEVVKGKENANTGKEYLQQTRRRRQQIQEDRRHKQQQQQQHQQSLQQQWQSSKNQKQQISTSQTILDINGTTIVSVDSFATSTAMMYDVDTGDECKTEIEPSSRILTPPSTLTLLLVPPTPSPPLTNVTPLRSGSSIRKVDRRYINDRNDNNNDDNDGLNSNIQKINEGSSKDIAKTRKVGVKTQHGIGGVVKGMGKESVVIALIGKKKGGITRNIETFRDRRPDSREKQDWEAKLESHEQDTTKLPRQLDDEVEVPSQHLPRRNESAKLKLKKIVLSSVVEGVVQESSKCDIDVDESEDDKNQILIQKQLAMKRTKAMAMEILGKFGKLGKYRKVIEKNKKEVRDKKDVGSLTIKEETTFSLQDRAWLNKGECSQRFSYVSPPSPPKITMIMNTTFSGSSQILISQSNLEENKGFTHDDKLDTTLMSSGLENHKYRTKIRQKLKETKSKLRHEQMLSSNTISEQEQRKGLENDTTNSPSPSYHRDLDFHDNTHGCNNLATLLPPNKKCNVGSDRFIDKGSTSEKESYESIIRKLRKKKKEFMISLESTKSSIQMSNPLEVDHFPAYLSPQISNETVLSSEESIHDDSSVFDDNTGKSRNKKEVTLTCDDRDKLGEPEEFKELLIHAQKSYPLDYLLVDSSSMWSSNSGTLPDCSIGLLLNKTSQEFLLHSSSTPTVTTCLSCNKIKNDPILTSNVKGKDVSYEKKYGSMYSENKWYASLPILPFKFDPNDNTSSCKSLNSVLIDGEVSTILKHSTAKEDLPVYEYLWKNKSDEKECITNSEMFISQNDINCNIVSQLTEERRRERSLDNALYEYDDSFLSRNIMEKAVLNESSMERWETEARKRVLNARTNLQHLSIFSKQ